jgi:hypothetical protein
MVFSTAGFPSVFSKKRLELKSLKRQTKAEEHAEELSCGARRAVLLIVELSIIF